MLLWLPKSYAAPIYLTRLPFPNASGLRQCYAAPNGNV